STDGDEGVDLEVVQVLLDALDPALDLQRIGPRRAEDRPAARQDAAHGLHVEREAVSLERPAPAVTEADELVPVARDALAYDGADDGVQAGTIASTREHSDAHAVLLAVPRAPGVRSYQHDPPQESDQRRLSRR